VAKVPPLGGARSTTNLFEKSSPPVSRLAGGMTMSLTSELTIRAKGRADNHADCEINRVTLIANSLNSFHPSSRRFIRQH
jgi:hypothetical protein